MRTPSVNYLQYRTDAKLRYAKLHLDELMAREFINGDDFDRAHQESFLFHLMGASDAFLHELNHYYDAGLPQNDITLGKLYNALETKGTPSPEGSALYKLSKDNGSWLKQAKNLRDAGTHIQGARREFIIGGPNSGTVKLKDPITDVSTDGHFLESYRLWWEQMSAFIMEKRRSALAYYEKHVRPS